MRRESEAVERRHVERLVHGVLLAGVIGSAAFLGAGTWIALLTDGHRMPRAMVGVHELAPALAHLRADALLTVGLAMLIATPIVRVAGSILAFLVARDFRYALVSAVVLATILASVLSGRG